MFMVKYIFTGIGHSLLFALLFYQDPRFHWLTQAARAFYYMIAIMICIQLSKPRFRQETNNIKPVWVLFTLIPVGLIWKLFGYDFLGFFLVISCSIYSFRIYRNQRREKAIKKFTKVIMGKGSS